MKNFYLGDCLEIMPTMLEKSVDMILCDLPYGTTSCKWDNIIPFDPLWENYWRVLKDDGVIVLTASQPFTTKLISSQIEYFKYSWIWDKKRPSNPMLAKKQPLKTHEDICVFYKKFAKYNPQGVFETDGKPRGGVNPTKTELGFGKSVKSVYKQTMSGYPKSILQFVGDNTKNIHPTQKPVDLFEYLIKTYTDVGDTVFDSCMGSGTTAIAAINCNRNWIGIEKDHDYYYKALNRIKNHNNIKNLFDT